MFSKNGGAGQLEWTPQPIAASYNTYRGTLISGAFSADHVCFEAGDALLDGVTTSTDPETPNPGDGFYYLVGTVDSCGESVLGRASDGGERPAVSGCP